MSNFNARTNQPVSDSVRIWVKNNFLKREKQLSYLFCMDCVFIFVAIFISYAFLKIIKKVILARASQSEMKIIITITKKKKHKKAPKTNKKPTTTRAICIGHD